MKNILLTESQMKLILKEEEKNDLIQTLIFSKPEDISFKMTDGTFGIPVSRRFMFLIPVINGVEIPRELVNLDCEEYNVDDELFWQLHIRINDKIQRLGIAEKIYTAFILSGNKVVSIFKNRASSFYVEKGKKIDSDNAISGLWEKLKQNPKIEIFQLGDSEGNVIGVTGELKQ
jgi:hypothetical protein